MSIADPKTPEEKRQHDELIKAAVVDAERKRRREKRQRGPQEARDVDFDVHDPFG